MTDKALRKNQILKAAEESFARLGFYGTDVAAIARAAGVAKGSIYNYFSSKEEILLSVIEKGMLDLDNKMRKGMQGIHGAVARIKKGVDIYTRHLEKNMHLFEILVSEKVRFKSRFERQYYNILFSRTVHLQRAIAQGIKDGELKKVDPFLASTCLNGMIDFMAYRGMMEGKKYSIADKAEQITKLFLEGILL